MIGESFLFFSPFPPDGHCHENYSEMHFSYSGNKVYIQFSIIKGNTFFGVVTFSNTNQASWRCYFYPGESCAMF